MAPVKADPTRDPLPPPFPVGTHLRCVEGHDAYVPSVERPRDIKAHPEDWARLSGRGIEVTISRVEPGRRGTGRHLRDEDGPMHHDDGEPMIARGTWAKAGAKFVSHDKRFTIMKSRSSGGFDLLDLDTYNEYPTASLQEAKELAARVRRETH
jgi:hypothetical protein